MRLEAGERVVDRYELVRELGVGGMGAVWAARDVQTDETVALKTLLPDMLKIPDVVRRFLREARAAMAVNHPNVVRIREVVMAGEEPVIVMDYLRGESLKARLDRERRMALHEFATLFVPVVSALGTAHASGIVHRDLKPDNIFLVKQPDGVEDPRVVDFGIAKLTAIDGDAQKSGHLTTTGAVLGTPYYMSPEQVFGDKNIDHRTDIWSLGIMAYECLAGRRPVDGENIRQNLRVPTPGANAKPQAAAPGPTPALW